MIEPSKKKARCLGVTPGFLLMAAYRLCHVRKGNDGSLLRDPVSTFLVNALPGRVWPMPAKGLLDTRCTEPATEPLMEPPTSKGLLRLVS